MIGRFSEAMINAIPADASDRGARPEALGDAGIVLALPHRLTTSPRTLPTAAEIGPWVDLSSASGTIAERGRERNDGIGSRSL
jgi:hypothetical protein